MRSCARLSDSSCGEDPTSHGERDRRAHDISSDLERDCESVLLLPRIEPASLSDCSGRDSPDPLLSNGPPPTSSGCDMLGRLEGPLELFIKENV
jgi:hypothetical protein